MLAADENVIPKGCHTFKEVVSSKLSAHVTNVALDTQMHLELTPIPHSTELSAQYEVCAPSTSTARNKQCAHNTRANRTCAKHEIMTHHLQYQDTSERISCSA